MPQWLFIDDLTENETISGEFRVTLLHLVIITSVKLNWMYQPIQSLSCLLVSQSTSQTHPISSSLPFHHLRREHAYAHLTF